MRKALVTNNGKTYDTIHQVRGFLETIKDKFGDDIYNYFIANKKKSLKFTNLTICTIVGNFSSDGFSNGFTILKDGDGNMCIMESSRGWEHIFDGNRLILLTEIFEQYRG